MRSPRGFVATPAIAAVKFDRRDGTRGKILPHVPQVKRPGRSADSLAGRDFDHHGGDSMLVLGRKNQECIMIGDDIVIQVVRIDRNQVKIGIVAPDSVPVHRAEIWLKNQEQKGESK